MSGAPDQAEEDPDPRLRQYGRGADGSWHDVLLMDLPAAELIR